MKQHTTVACLSGLGGWGYETGVTLACLWEEGCDLDLEVGEKGVTRVRLLSS